MRARALEFVAPRRVALVDVDLRAPRDGEILVRTVYSGISSGTELLAYRGEIDPALALDEAIDSLRGSFTFPFRYGYSCVGVVEESKASVPTGTNVFALHPHQDHFVCAADQATVVADVDLRIATLFPLVETGLQIALDVGRVVADDVVVSGLGAVGLVTALLLQRAGARVIGIEPRHERRDLARDLDLHALDPREAPEAVARITAGSGVPLVVEVSGHPNALDVALSLLAHEGTALVGSWYGTKPVTLRLGDAFHRRRLTIRSTQVSTIPAELSSHWTVERRRNEAVRLLGELPLKRLASHEFAFDDAAKAFAALDAGEEDIVHAALVYGSD